MKQNTNPDIKTAKKVANSKQNSNPIKKELKVVEKKDKIYALTSFICGLLFWVPLFNWVLGPMAIIFGIFALKYQRADPQRYGGQAYAIIGIILGATSVIFTIIGVYVTIFHPELLGFNSTLIKP
jgi:hypothetical protein